MKSIKRGIFLIFLVFNLVNVNLFAQNNHLNFQQNIKSIESKYGGKIGIFVIDTANNKTLNYQANKRFPFCSTFKFIVVGAILNKASKNLNLLNEKISYSKADLVNAYSPYTIKNLDNGNHSMSIKSLCKAAMLSDTTATNLLIKRLGGIEKINQFAKRAGNESFRLDRWEPYINTAIPGDSRDTSTPKDMAKIMQQLALGNQLTPKLKLTFQQWLIENNTGDQRIRAVVNKSWVVGDKTGTGDYGTTNDVAVLWPPNQKPIIISVYYTQDGKEAKANDRVIQLATKAAFNSLEH